MRYPDYRFPNNADGKRRACYFIQAEVLRLPPWQEPPAIVDERDPNERAKDAQALLRKMLSLGVSRFSPNPMRDVAVAESKRETEHQIIYGRNKT